MRVCVKVVEMHFRAPLCSFTVFVLYLLTTAAQGNPLPDGEEAPSNMVNGFGQKVLDKFDQVFYGLLDEAATHVTKDKKGAFKDMLIRHRGDLVKNVKENLVNKDKISLDDVKKAIERELDNRVELFNYVGGGLWGKVSSWSSKMYSNYKNHCAQDPKSVWCLSRYGGGSKDTGPQESSGSAEDGIEKETFPEREYTPQ